VDQRFRKHERLTAPADFRRCYRQGQRLRTSYFIVYAYRRGAGAVRLGLAVGKAIGSAVVRNRVKRRLRELFRRHKASVPEGYDLFVRATPPSATASFAELKQAWRHAIGILQGQAGAAPAHGAAALLGGRATPPSRGDATSPPPTCGMPGRVDPAG
jgi:ribonuclease P protein component